MTPRLGGIAAGVVVAAALLAAAEAAASDRYDPRLRFKTMSTPRFDIHFHQGEEDAATRLAAFIEEAAAEVDAAIGPPAGRVQVILVDQHDVSNGWATPIPYNTIEITAAAPPAESLIGNVDDWLRTVFVHEYTHIAHLSRAGGWIGRLRRVFGRSPFLFPNLFQPVWGIEGLATWQESAATGAGRVPAGDFQLLIARAAAAGRFEPIDRASGGNVDWPSGITPYVYGAYFHEFLAERHGPASLRALADETSRRLPYFGAVAYRKVFGRSLGALWDDFRDATSGEGDLPDGAFRLTHHGFIVTTPRYGEDGRLYYAMSNPHGFPAVMMLRPGDAPREVTRRYGGNRLAVAGSRLVMDEIGLVRNAALRADLWLMDLRDGSRRRLTAEARALDPDISRDGVIACVVQRGDRRALATLALRGQAGTAVPEVLLSEPFTDFSSPRWSPDGRWIAAERRRLGGPSEIVLVDPVARTARLLAGLPGGRSASPSWTPDGAYVLFSSAPGGEPFRIFRVPARGGDIARLEGTGRAARSPDVSPDGRTVVFVGYTASGYDLFELALQGARWTPVGSTPPADGDSAAPAARPAAMPGARPYSPLGTLAPQSWTPVIASDSGEVVVGAGVGTTDALGRHAYTVQAGWSQRTRPDWQVAYTYDRWRPIFFATASDDVDPWREGTWQTRQANAGMLLRLAGIRSTHVALASFHLAQDDVRCDPCVPPLAERGRTSALRAGWAFSSAREFGYSISAAEGARLVATVEAPSRALGSHGNGLAATADARGYVRAWPRHGVIALRAAGAAAWGEQRRLFSAAGAGPEASGFDFGRGAVGLLRGFDQDDVIGTRVVVVNADYRVPLAYVGRGVGTLPLFLRSLHGSLFVDAGHAWTGPVRWQDVRLSAGAEVSADTVVGFAVPLTLTLGGAWTRDGATGASGAGVFARIGRAF